VYESFLEMCPRRDYRYKVWNSFHTVGTNLTTDIRLHTYEVINEIRQCRSLLSLFFYVYKYSNHMTAIWNYNIVLHEHVHRWSMEINIGLLLFNEAKVVKVMFLL
jgi:hypothetical protein